MHGRTPGKRIAGVHIATRTGSSPTVGALLTRNVFRLVDSLPFLYGVGLMATLVTRDHIRIGDMAAGTFLAYDRPAPPGPVRNSMRPPLDDLEIANELLQRWPSLTTQARRALAIALLSRLNVQATNGAQSDPELRSTLERLVQARPS